MKYIIWIIVIIVIIVGAKYLLPNEVIDINDKIEVNEEVISDITIEDTSNTVVITYTNSGFNPSSVNIESGQTVRFVNESSDNMWVASAFHPTHKVFPEFDNKKSIGNGEIYEFTFAKTGEWKYHNHIKPNAFGTVIVK